MPDSLRRALRTFVQGAIGILMLTAIGPLNELVTGVVSGDGYDAKIDLDIWRNIALAAFAGGMVALISFIHNSLEDHTNFPAIGKATPSAGQNPVTRDPAV